MKELSNQEVDFVCRIQKKETNRVTAREGKEEVAAEATVTSKTVRLIVVAGGTTTTTNERRKESGADQDHDRMTTTGHRRKKARDVNEEVSQVLQVIGVPTSTEAIGKRAKNAEMNAGQVPGLTRGRNLV